MATLTVACFVAGVIAGWLLRTIFAVAEISASRKRMQKEVQHWRREAVQARAVAEQLAWRLAGHDPPAEPPDLSMGQSRLQKVAAGLKLVPGIV
jgi:hypothetical protein